MAPSDLSYDVITLRAVALRLNSTPVQQLPNLVPYLASQLASCAAIFEAPPDSAKQDGTDVSVLLHKLKTRISSLLQDRTPEGRWAGTIMAKCTVELGSHEMLQSCAPWVRSLLAILNKNDPFVTKRLCIVVLTRIFILTREYPTLVREITTPNLPAFVASCIQILQSSQSAISGTDRVTQATLESLSRLVTRHPAIFRTYINQLNPLLLSYLAPVSTSHSENVPLARFPICEVRHLARRLFVQLNECTPKGMASDSWERTVQQVITTCHETADQVFRSVVEDWESTCGYNPVQHNIEALSLAPARFEPDDLGLGPWSGLTAGTERLTGLLAVIQQCLSTATSFTASTKTGALIDLLKRLLSTARPTSLRDWETSGRADAKFERKEREELSSVLPDIHSGAIDVVSAFVERFGRCSSSVLPQVMDLLAWNFDKENSSQGLRRSAYMAFAQILPIVGPTLRKAAVDSLVGVIRACCDDLYSGQLLLDEQPGFLNGSQSKIKKGDSLSITGLARKNQQTRSIVCRREAYELLPTIIANVPAHLISKRLSSTIERTAILSHHREAVLARIRHPSPHHASIAPFLMQLFPEDVEVQSLLKPRTPVESRQQGIDQDDDDEEEEEHSGENRLVMDNAGHGPQTEMSLGDRRPDSLQDPVQNDVSRPAESTPTAATSGRPNGSPAASSLLNENATETEESNKRAASGDSSRSPKRARVEQAPDFAPHQVVVQTQTPNVAMEASTDLEVPAVQMTQERPATDTSVLIGDKGHGTAESDDDDENFDIPQLVMGADSEESED